MILNGTPIHKIRFFKKIVPYYSILSVVIVTKISHVFSMWLFLGYVFKSLMFWFTLNSALRKMSIEAKTIYNRMGLLEQVESSLSMRTRIRKREIQSNNSLLNPRLTRPPVYADESIIIATRALSYISWIYFLLTSRHIQSNNCPSQVLHRTDVVRETKHFIRPNSMNQYFQHSVSWIDWLHVVKLVDVNSKMSIWILWSKR